jgi:hypothetical protein
MLHFDTHKRVADNRSISTIIQGLFLSFTKNVLKETQQPKIDHFFTSQMSKKNT